MRRRRNHPEWRGDGTAKALELKRAKRVRQRQLELAQKRMTELEEKPMQTIRSGGNSSRTFNRGQKLDQRVVDILRKKIARSYEDTRDELKDVVRRLGGDPKHADCGYQLRKLRKDDGAKYLDYWRNYLEVLAGVRGNVRTVEVPILKSESVDTVAARQAQAAQSIDASRAPELEEATDTGIVRYVEGIPFTLSSLSRYGAETARITLTHLAEKLGYSDKSKLKQLAERHAKELAELGSSATVAVLVHRESRGSVSVQEPTYNPDQAAYLALSSETEQGRACRVRILKAYKALLAMFEQVASAPQPTPATIDYQAMGTAMGTVVASAVTSAVTGAVITAIREFLPRRSPRRRKPEMNPDQQTIPEANLRLVPDPPPVPRKDTSHLLMGHPRLQRMPRPADVKDPKLFQTLRNAIDAYGQITSNFDEPYLLVYDEINRTFDPELTKRKHGERIQYIGSQCAKYQRQAYEAAYRVLVAPYLKAAS